MSTQCDHSAVWLDCTQSTWASHRIASHRIASHRIAQSESAKLSDNAGQFNHIATLFRIDGQPAAATGYAWRWLRIPSTLAAIAIARAIESRSRGGCVHVALRVGGNVRAVAAMLVEEVGMGLQHRLMPGWIRRDTYQRGYPA